MTAEDRQHIAALAIAGICSAVLSGSLVTITNDTLSPFIPGLVYGLVIGLYFLSVQNKTALFSTLLFVIFSTGSYFAALMLTYYLPLQTVFLVLLFPAVFIYAGVLVCGIIGTSLFLISFSKLIFPLRRSEFKKLLLIGSLLSLVCQFLFIASFGQGTTFIPKEFVYGVFFIWQTGMAIALGWVITHSTQVKTNHKPSMQLIILGGTVLLILVSTFSFYYNNFVIPLDESTPTSTGFACLSPDGQPCPTDLLSPSPTPVTQPLLNPINGSSSSTSDSR